ncbi:frataxin homolog, mitochondrial [[Candida] railenensis]|uniref:ferroxidase n=1 Tax=[Candida] railenensis TaxID=45579 RepID=A0A9P0QMN3_9ASCO|nr:frataxin homolog, mitochondrial [[Candida] railenensis]
MMFRRISRNPVRTFSSPLLRCSKAVPLRSFQAAILSKPSKPQLRMYSLSTEGELIEDKIDVLTDHEYSSISNNYLETLGDELEALSEDHPQVDSELSQGVLKLDLPPLGSYVINKQPPNKQMWLSSPLSGPKRYDLIGGKWITLRDNSGLTGLLEDEISQALDIKFKFEGLDN